MAQVERKMIQVACHVPNGIMIRRSKQGFDDGTGDGVKPIVHDGPGVRLNGPSPLHTGVGATSRMDIPPGITDVDAEWWDAWFKQNQEYNPLLTMNQVYALKAADKNPTP